MSERDDRYARPDLPSTTAEFRATPDASASTAQFKAFADGQPEHGVRASDAGAWPEQPWAGGAPGSRHTRTVVMVTVIAIIVLIFIGVFMFG